MLIDPGEGFALALNASFELGLADAVENRSKRRPGLEPVAYQVVAGQHGRRVDRAGWLGLEVVSAVIDVFGKSRRSQRICAVQLEQVVDAGFRQDLFELGFAQLPGLAQVLMEGDEPGDPLALVIGKLELAAEAFGDPRAGLLVIVEGRAPDAIRGSPALPASCKSAAIASGKLGCAGSRSSTSIVWSQRSPSGCTGLP